MERVALLTDAMVVIGPGTSGLDCVEFSYFPLFAGRCRRSLRRTKTEYAQEFF
jgi:hypothetical protein